MGNNHSGRPEREVSHELPPYLTYRQTSGSGGIFAAPQLFRNC